MRSPVGIVHEFDQQIAATRAKDDGRVRVTWRETPDGAVKTASRGQFASVDEAAEFLTRAWQKFGRPLTDAERRVRDARYDAMKAGH